MKALAIDTAVSCIYIAVKNNENTVTLSLNLGMRQAEKLLPAIDYVLAQSGFSAEELDYMTLTRGPGSFTGLRLGMSALKAINLSKNIPIYGINTLDAYAYPFKTYKEKIISVIDAKKDRFYNSIYLCGKRISDSLDEEPIETLKRIDLKSDFLVIGSDAPLFCSAVKELVPSLNIRYSESKIATTDSLFAIAEEMIANNEQPIQDYDGPFYIRKSEAEEKLSQ